jgi:hypothetical protein
MSKCAVGIMTAVVVGEVDTRRAVRVDLPCKVRAGGVCVCVCGRQSSETARYFSSDAFDELLVRRAGHAKDKCRRRREVVVSA